MKGNYDDNIVYATATAVNYDYDHHQHSSSAPEYPRPYPLHSQGSVMPSQSRVIDEVNAISFLTSKNWPVGLQKQLIRGLSKVAYRVFICDDSGSMAGQDGQMLVDNKKMMSCSRWSELTDTLKFHIALASASQSPTEFRLLNALSPVVVGEDPGLDERNIQTLLDVFESSPGGGTPLCRHLNEIYRSVVQMKSHLQATGQKVSIIIATDGESSDGDIANALRPFHSLPVHVVIRLCTNDSRITDYWNRIDADLELELDILDDLSGECEEVMGNNPWLNYCQPVHRFRESGIIIKDFDSLDEGKLTHEQVRNFCRLLFDKADLPHPEVDWNGFENTIKSCINSNSESHYNTRNRKLMKLVSLSHLKSMYKKGGACNVM